MFLLERKRQPRLPFAALVVFALVFSCAAQTPELRALFRGALWTRPEERSLVRR